MTVFSLLAVSAVAVASMFQSSRDGEVTLSSINFWEITLDIVMFPEIQDAVEISAVQRQQILEMRSRKDLHEMIRNKSLEIQESDVAISNHSEYLAVDEQIKAELSKILRPEQMKIVKLVKIRSRFATGYSPFLDPEVIDVCKLTRKQAAKLALDVDNAMNSYKKVCEKSLDFRLLEIVDSLPVESQSLFAQYAGSCVPFIDAIYDCDFDVIPFPSYVKSVSTVGTASSFEQFQKESGLTVDQISRLKSLYAECDLSFFPKQKKYNSMAEFSRSLNEYSFNEMRKILTKEQLLRVARVQAGGEFKMNPIAPLSRSDFVAFLKIPNSEIETVRSVAKKETARHVAEVKVLNKTTFEQLNRTLPETAQAKMRQLFIDVWAE